MSEAFGLQHELELLHDEYVYRVNVLVAEGREDLVSQLSDRFGVTPHVSAPVGRRTVSEA
jgi:hypothetical protein